MLPSLPRLQCAHGHSLLLHFLLQVFPLQPLCHPDIEITSAVRQEEGWAQRQMASQQEKDRGNSQNPALISPGRARRPPRPGIKDALCHSALASGPLKTHLFSSFHTWVRSSGASPGGCNVLPLLKAPAPCSPAKQEDIL